MRPLSERGLTLTELTIVAALATVVMLGLVGFYLNSQAMWMDASSQAITQREAASVLDEISRRVRESDHAYWYPITHRLDLHEDDETLVWSYWWNVGGDWLIHEGNDGVPDKGAMETSKADAFDVVVTDSLVVLRLQLRSAQGDSVPLFTRTAFQDRRR